MTSNKNTSKQPQNVINIKLINSAYFHSFIKKIVYQKVTPTFSFTSVSYIFVFSDRIIVFSTSNVDQLMQFRTLFTFDTHVVYSISSLTKSSEISPFDRAHITSYSTLIETMLLSCTVFEL